jgi:hypothetical protein
MGQDEDADFGADQKEVVDTSWKSNLRRTNEIIERLDAIALEKVRVIEEFDELDSRIDALHIEEKRIEDHRDRLMEDLDGLQALGPTDLNEDVDTSVDDGWDDIWKNIVATDLELSRLHQKQEDINRRSDVLSRQMSQLDQEEDDLGQENEELKREWRHLMTLSPSDEEEDEEVEVSTDKEEFTAELDDVMSLSLGQMVAKLCAMCRNAAQGRSTDCENMHHPSLSSLKTSVDGGCYLCADVAEALDEFCNKSEPPVAKRDFWSIQYAIYGDKSHLWLNFSLCQCEIVHPVGEYCKDGQRLQFMQFYPARGLGLGPEFLGVSSTGQY